MRRWSSFIGILVVTLFLNGCVVVSPDKITKMIKGEESAADTKTAPPSPGTTADDTKATEPKASEPTTKDTKVTNTKTPEPKAAEEKPSLAEAYVYNSDIERSNLFQGSHVVSGGGYLYMSSPDYKGLYRVSPDGKEAKQITDAFCENLIYHDGYIYYISREDYVPEKDPARFSRIKAGSTEEEVIMEYSFYSFFIVDGELYYYNKIGESMGSYYETEGGNLYRASLDNPEDAEIVYMGKYIFRAWEVDGKIIMLVEGDEQEDYPPYYVTDIVELDPDSGDWEVIYNDDGFMDDFLPYENIYIVQPHIFDVFNGNDCSLYGLDINQPEDHVFMRSGKMSIDGEVQYMIKGSENYDDENFEECLIKSENWGQDYEILFDLTPYIAEGHYPSTRVFRAGDYLYLYVNVCPYNYMGPKSPDIIIRYDIESGVHELMDIFE